MTHLLNHYPSTDAFSGSCCFCCGYVYPLYFARYPPWLWRALEPNLFKTTGSGPKRTNKNHITTLSLATAKNPKKQLPHGLSFVTQQYHTVVS